MTTTLAKGDDVAFEENSGLATVIPVEAIQTAIAAHLKAG